MSLKDDLPQKAFYVLNELASGKDLVQLIRQDPSLKKEDLCKIFQYAASCIQIKSGKAKVFIDGASKGNPGPAGIGVVIYDSKGNVVERIQRFIGHATNNIAEYTALLTGMERTRDLGFKEAEFLSDSELLIKQITGLYKVKNERLRSLYQKIKEIEAFFEDITYRHLQREENREADNLANNAIL
jgi:ribonuclease HI